MRRLALLGCALTLVGCAKREAAPAADTMAAAPAAMLSPADVAGNWTIKVMGQGSDSVLVTYDMMASNTAEGWTVTLPNRPAMTPKVQFSGDSVIIDLGPYESVLRKGVQVTTHSVARMMGGKMMGTAVAHYSAGPDSVRMLRSEGTRKP